MADILYIDIRSKFIGFLIRSSIIIEVFMCLLKICSCGSCLQTLNHDIYSVLMVAYTERTVN